MNGRKAVTIPHVGGASFTAVNRQMCVAFIALGYASFAEEKKK